MAGQPGQSPQAAPQPAADAQVERRIADLHRRLHITPAQEPQFAAFAQQMRANAQEMAALRQQLSQNPHMNAVESLHAYAQLAEAHAQALNRLVPPFQAFYDSLSDPQKRTADALLGGAAQGAAQRLTHGPQRR